MTVVSDSGTRALSAEAVGYMTESLRAERALVLLDQGGPELTCTGSFGIDPDTVWTTAPLSLTLLRKVQANGAPLVSADAQRDHGDQWSLQVSNIRSVICVPLFRMGEHGVAGLLYGDICLANRGFNRNDLNNLITYARRFERLVFGQQSPGAYGRAPESFPLAPEPAPIEGPPEQETIPVPVVAYIAKEPKPVAEPEPKPAPKPLRKVSSRQPKPLKEVELDPTSVKSESLVVGFRSLATMMNAGISIPRALELLADQSEDPNFSRVCQGILSIVLGACPFPTR